jgi:hypothetical protein
MPYLFEALLFAAPFALYAIWLRLNPGQAVATHLLAVALVGLILAIGAAAWYGLSRGMDPNTAYVPPRSQNGRIAPGHGESTRPPGPWPPVTAQPELRPPHEGPAPAPGPR